MPKSVTSPVHPGEILLEDYMKPEGITSGALALALRIPVARVDEIVTESRGISGDTALRLGRYFSNSAEFWMNLQRDYEIRMARNAAKEAIERDVHPRAAA